MYVRCRLSRGSAEDLKAAAALLLVPWYAFRGARRGSGNAKAKQRQTTLDTLNCAKTGVKLGSRPLYNILRHPTSSRTVSNMRFFSPSAKLARAMFFSARLDSRWCTRGLHQRRALLYKLEDGLGEFLPPPALKSIAVDWHGGLLDRLNDEIRGTSQAAFRSVPLTSHNQRHGRRWPYPGKDCY